MLISTNKADVAQWNQGFSAVCWLSLSHSFHILAFICMGYCNVKSGDLFLQIGGLSNYQIQWVQQRVIFSHPYFRILPNLQKSTFIFSIGEISYQSTSWYWMKQIVTTWNKVFLLSYWESHQVIPDLASSLWPEKTKDTPVILETARFQI